MSDIHFEYNFSVYVIIMSDSQEAINTYLMYLFKYLYNDNKNNNIYYVVNNIIIKN